MHTQSQSFGGMGLSETMLQAIARKGFSMPSRIQSAAIPLLLGSNRDLIGQAKTGTGKTAAFGIPLLEAITHKSRYPQALILVPTRELAIQTAGELESLQERGELSIVPVYGGQPIGPQIRTLKRGSDIIVGTPGRVLDHIARGTIDFCKTAHVVLDEADEMLDQGFIEDIETILSSLPEGRRTILFSATMPKAVAALAERFMKAYDHISVPAHQRDEDLTEHTYIEVHEKDKFEALRRIIDSKPDFFGIVFCRTRIDTDRTAKDLQAYGYHAEALHGDLSQNHREQVLSACRARRTSILVATDVAARGIDIAELSHVINYALPQDARSYIHRIGRTGRAGKTGRAVTLVNPYETKRLITFQHSLKLNIKRETLPVVRDIVAVKRMMLQSSIHQIIHQQRFGEYLDAAAMLTEGQDPLAVIASLLVHTSQKDLCPSHYRELRKPKSENNVYASTGNQRYPHNGFKKRFKKSVRSTRKSSYSR